ADARPPAGAFVGMLFSAACALSLIPLTTAILAVQARGQFLNWVTEYRPWHKAFELLLLADGPTAAFPSWAPLAIATAVAVACRAIGRLRRKHEDQASADSPDLGSLRMFAFFVVWAA